MFNPNFLQEHFDTSESNFIPNDFPGFMLPGLDNFGSDMLGKDFSGFPMMPEFESFDPSSFMQYFDQALQSMPEEMKQWMTLPFDCVMPAGEGEAQTASPPSKPTFVYSRAKIGTLSQEERRQKVQKFLEKRKRRNFKKKISYMCRKKVADQRIRVKGRFVSKVQASAILEDQNMKDEE
jgi:hypothetical protein